MQICEKGGRCGAGRGTPRFRGRPQDEVECQSGRKAATLDRPGRKAFLYASNRPQGLVEPPGNVCGARSDRGIRSRKGQAGCRARRRTAHRRTRYRRPQAHAAGLVSEWTGDEDAMVRGRCQYIRAGEMQRLGRHTVRCHKSTAV